MGLFRKNKETWTLKVELMYPPYTRILRFPVGTSLKEGLFKAAEDGSVPSGFRIYRQERDSKGYHESNLNATTLAGDLYVMRPVGRPYSCTDWLYTWLPFDAGGLRVAGTQIVRQTYKGDHRRICSSKRLKWFRIPMERDDPRTLPSWPIGSIPYYRPLNPLPPAPNIRWTLHCGGVSMPMDGLNLADGLIAARTRLNIPEEFRLVREGATPMEISWGFGSWQIEDGDHIKVASPSPRCAYVGCELHDSWLDKWNWSIVEDLSPTIDHLLERFRQQAQDLLENGL